MDLIKLMLDACHSEDQDETALIALYLSAVSNGKLNDFVAATMDLMAREPPVNPLEPIAMEILPDALSRAAGGDKDAETVFIILASSGRAKEIVIALDEALGNVANPERVDDTEVEVETAATALELLVRGYTFSLPRLVPRRVKAEETVISTLSALRIAAAVALVTPNSQEAEVYLASTIALLDTLIEWCRKDSSSSLGKVKDDCRQHLEATLDVSAPFIRTCLGFKTFQELYPRQAIAASRHVDLSGVEIARQTIQDALRLSDSLGDSEDRRLSLVEKADGQDAFAAFVLLVHDFRIAPSFQMLQRTMPTTLTCLSSGILIDQTLAWVLRCVNPESEEVLEEGTVCTLSSVLAQVASVSPDTMIRQVAFQSMSDLLSRTSPLLRRQLLVELISDCPFPQMRTAAVSLLKRKILGALDSSDPSAMASSDSLPLLSLVLRFDADNVSQKTFSEVCEARVSTQLLEALGLYYIVLLRDTDNRTGIRNQSFQFSVEKTFLDPVREALSHWRTEIDGSGDFDLDLFSLEAAIERVDSALVEPAA